MNNVSSPVAGKTAAIQPLTHGTTGTGLDVAIELIGADYGLSVRLPGRELLGGMTAADGLNALIVQAIRATGAANDGTLSTSDLYSVNSWIRENHYEFFSELHGDDETGIETGYHLVQGDGATTRLYGQNGIDGVLDSIYHIGFSIENGRFVNEDGNANATVEDVAFWISDMIADDLAAGTLTNTAVDPQVHGTTGTGLDALLELIVDDTGLNDTISQFEINAGALAANGMNQIIVDGIRATGIADDGDLTALDLRDLNAWIHDNRLAEWTELHGDDETGTETGFHLVQGDGGTGHLFGEQAVNTVADGLYHIGFDIMWNRFVNEDGNGNATLDDAAQWLSILLADDLADGSLDSGRGPVNPTRFADDIGYKFTRAVTVEDRVGHVEVGKPAALRDASGTFAMRFTADTPDDGSYQVLFSKDGSGNAAGDISVYLHDGQLWVTMEDGTNTTWLKAEGHMIEAGRTYDLAVSFGRDGLEISLNGEKVAVNDDFTAGMLNNTRAMVIGAGTWGRSPSDPNATWNHFDGKIEGFTFYDRQLNAFEIAGLAQSEALESAQPGAPVLAGDLPAVRAGTGLKGEVFDRTGRFENITDLIAQSATQSTPNRGFTADRVDFGATAGETTLGGFFDDAATLKNGGASTDMNTIGLHMTGYVWIPAGAHVITVMSDDGFQLALGGETVSSYAWDRGYEGTSRQFTFTGGLYQIDLYYFENSSDQGLQLLLDGKVMGDQHFYQTVADYQQALTDNGAAPEGGLPPVYEGPVGTTGTGLDQIIRVIGEDQGLAHNVSTMEIFAGAAAADTINRLIIEAIRETGAANDGVITTSETYDLSDYIRTHDYAAFVAAHGDDENGSETGYHLLQNDGATTRIYGDNAINTVFDGLYHIGFQTVFDRFANEDGDANARVETVAYWLNTLLAADLEAGTLANDAVGGPVNTGLLGTAAEPNVVSKDAMTSVLGPNALTLKLTGTSQNGIGNAKDNTLTGNALGNLLDGAKGNDTLIGANGNDTLIGGGGADTLNGGRDMDVLIGGAGDDILIGSTGMDMLTGGQGADQFTFLEKTDGVDTITDFMAGLDKIVVDASRFGGGLSAGSLAGNRLVVSGTPAATQGFGQFLYDQDDGKLYFDNNGTATGGLVQIAVLQGAPVLAASDFLITA